MLRQSRNNRRKKIEHAGTGNLQRLRRREIKLTTGTARGRKKNCGGELREDYTENRGAKKEKQTGALSNESSKPL